METNLKKIFVLKKQTMFLQDCIDQVMVLTLESKTQVHKDIETHLSAFGLIPTFFKVKGVFNKKNNGQGKLSLSQILSHETPDEVSKDIYENHIEMIRKAYNKGWDRVLFLEDDARFEPSIDKKQIVNIQNFLKTKEWDIFYLGYCPWPYIISFPLSPNIVRIPSPLLAHSYILSRSGMKKVLDYHQSVVLPSKKPIHFDKMLAELTDCVKVGTYPTICFQKDEPALFKEAQEKLAIPFSFKAINKCLEHFALLWPILVLLLLIFWAVRKFKQ